MAAYQTLFTHSFVMPMMLSMAPLHSLGHSHQNEVKHDFFSPVIPLAEALLLGDANCIINGTIFSLDEDN